MKHLPPSSPVYLLAHVLPSLSFSAAKRRPQVPKPSSMPLAPLSGQSPSIPFRMPYALLVWNTRSVSGPLHFPFGAQLVSPALKFSFALSWTKRLFAAVLLLSPSRLDISPIRQVGLGMVLLVVRG